jgi:IclR family mhp operon transcriptional activator
MDPGIRSCVRGLELLKALNANNYATALELSRLTHLPRPTVYRLLSTLVEAGFVSRDECTDVFYVTGAVTALSSGFGPGARAIQAATPRIKEFSDAICWPSFLHERVDDAMVTRAIVRSPRSFGYPKIGKRHPILASSPGRAFLSSLDAADRQRWVQRLPDPKRRELDALIRDAGVLGCGFRDGGLVPRTCSLSLPIRHRGDPVAYWTIVVMSSTFSVGRAISTYLDDAKALVSFIEADLEAPPAHAPR